MTASSGAQWKQKRFELVCLESFHHRKTRSANVGNSMRGKSWSVPIVTSVPESTDWRQYERCRMPANTRLQRTGAVALSRDRLSRAELRLRALRSPHS